MFGRIVVRIVSEPDTAAGDPHHVGNIDFETGNLDTEFARHAEGIKNAAAAGNRSKCGKNIDVDIKGTQQPFQFSGDAAG